MVTQDGIDLVFKALADPTRRSVLASLKRQTQAVLTISESFPTMSRPAISKHLRILREAGLVEEEQRGRQRFYRFVEGSLDDVGNWVGDFSAAGAVTGTVAARGDVEGRKRQRAVRRPLPPVEVPGRQDWRVW